ncbi:hypothetical protein R1flu_011319 [Riccia fluitans]|uniref:Uncharacterized protein n=1 Tax=Riccia fluitans TaxID=41844 RepID=A0ABD1ZAN5_9MARC
MHARYGTPAAGPSRRRKEGRTERSFFRRGSESTGGLLGNQWAVAIDPGAIHGQNRGGEEEDDMIRLRLC